MALEKTAEKQGLLGFSKGKARSVTAKVGGKGGPIIIIPPDDGPEPQ